ncbi:MAG: hypothetical protein B0D89_02610, partial [Candidatus Sedimenticola endophacoides]
MVLLAGPRQAGKTTLVRQIAEPRVSLPRERFWDIPVPKIDSPTRQPLLPRPSCAHHDSVPHIAAKLLVR